MKETEIPKTTVNMDQNILQDVRMILVQALGQSADTITDKQLEGYALLLQQELQSDMGIHVRFEQQVFRTPLATAITPVTLLTNGDSQLQHLTYQELNQRANRLAHALKKYITPESIVGIGIERSVEQVIILLSVLKAGAAYCLLEPGDPAKRISNLVEQAPLSIAIARRSANTMFSMCSIQFIELEQLDMEATMQSDENLPFEGISRTLAYVNSHANLRIALDHQSVLKRIDRMQTTFALTEADGFLAALPFLPDAIVVEVFWPLLYGASVTLLPSTASDQLLQALEHYQGTVFYGLSSTLTMLLSQDHEKTLHILKSLRLILCSGEPPIQEFAEKVGGDDNISLYYLYHAAEIDIELLVLPYQSKNVRHHRIVGETLIGLSAYVLDRDAQLAAIGVIGTIYVAGNAFSPYDTDTKNNLPFVQNRVSEDVLVATKCLGRQLSDGQIEVVDSTRVAWIAGKRVFLPEVEAILLQDPQVEDCAVLVQRSDNANPELVAYIVPSRSSFSQERLREHLETLLPNSLGPHLFARVSTIPQTEAGLPDEHALAHVEIIDADFVSNCEQHIRSLVGAKQVAVLVQTSQEKQPLRHISDMLLQAIPVKTASENMQQLVSTAVLIQQEQSRPLALVHGPLLHQQPGIPHTLAETLFRAARLFPEKGMQFIRTNEDDVVQSYADLFNEAMRIMGGLQQRGLRPQDKVIFQLERNWDILPAFWGCILGGFIPAILAVPPTYDEQNSILDRLKNTWKMLERPLILLSTSADQEIDMLAQFIADEEQVSLAMIEDLRKSEPATAFYPSLPDDIAFFSLTSGSTGIPKCIMLSHRNLLVHARGANQLCNRSSDDCIFNWLPFDHIGSISEYHIRCVDLGCQMVYASTYDVLKQPLLWLDIIDKYRCTHSWAANFAYALLIEALQQRPQASWDLSCITSLLTAGEAVSTRIVAQFLETFAPYGLKRSVMQPAFGMAELGSGITYFLPSETIPFKIHSIDKSSLQGTLEPCVPSHPNSIHFIDLGPVIPGCSIRIVDDTSSLLPEETIGRLQVSGDMVFHGYYKNREANREVFTLDGWFTTGDLGFIKDGQLVITGREKETIIINGANYYNYEIESIVEELESVEPSFTLACTVKDATLMTERLALFFVPIHVEEHDLRHVIKEIRKLVTKKIGIRPDYILPVARQDIPKTSIGKLQRTQMSKRFEQGAFQQLLKHLDILLENDNTVPEWFYRKGWQKKKSAAGARFVEPPSSVLVFLDDQGLGEALRDHYSASTVRVQRRTYFERVGKHSFYLNPGDLGHYIQLFTCLAEEQLYPDLIVHLWNYTASLDTPDTADALKRVLDTQVKQYLYLLRALAQTRDDENTLRLVVGASNTHPITEMEKIAYEKALGPSILKCAAQELPWLQCQHVDLPQEQITTDLACLLQELFSLSHDLDIAYRNGERLIARFEQVDLMQRGEQVLPFQHEGMYVLSGGLGGIGIEIAKYLLKQYQARVLLIGRTVLPGRDRWKSLLEQGDKQTEHIKTLWDLEQMGGKVQYETVDVCDPGAVQMVTERLSQQWQKPIAGIIHLAGSYHEQVLLEESPEEFCALLYPKIVGAWELYEIIKDNPQAIFINFSSLSGFFGGSMIGAYSAANSIIEAFASSISHQSTIRSYCLAWSVWEGIGMSRKFERKEILEAKGFQLISRQRGLNSFLAALQKGEQQLFIGIDGRKQNIQRVLKHAPLASHKITAYITRPAAGDVGELPQSIVVHDHFQKPCVCTLNYLLEMPLLPNGDPDYEQLKLLNSSTPAGENAYIAPRTQIEQQITHIWQEVLGVPRVGIYDNFFELGGDSIQLTQIISKLRQIGLHLTVKQLFQHNTVAALSEVIGTTTMVAAEQGVVEGDVPLTSAEWTFFAKNLPNPHYFNQAYAFETKQVLKPSLVEKTVAYLLIHHDALRLRFQFTREEGYRQQNIAQEQTNCFWLVSIANITEQKQAVAIAKHVEEAHASLNLHHGPLMRVVLFDLEQGQQHLFFVLHHLVTDGVSWRIFLEDFGAVYRQLEYSERPQLPPKTSSFRSWAQRLAHYASSQEVRNDLPYWLEHSHSNSVKLLYASPNANNQEKLAQVIKRSLTVEETQILLQQVPNFYEATVVEILLSALSEAFIAWVGNGSLPLELTHHGRDPLFEDLDVSRTLGWFSIAFPILLDMTPVQTLHDRVTRNKAITRRVPNHGYSYGLLRYICSDQSIKERMQSVPQPEILFSYLGQVDHVRSESAALKPTPELRGSLHDPEGKRLYKLVFNGRRVNGRLEIICIYGQAIIKEAIIEKLVENFVGTLRAMIAECRAQFYEDR